MPGHKHCAPKHPFTDQTTKSEMEKAAALRSAKEEDRRQEQATEVIRASGEYKAAFITDALIEAKENEILRRKH